MSIGIEKFILRIINIYPFQFRSKDLFFFIKMADSGNRQMSAMKQKYTELKTKV